MLSQTADDVGGEKVVICHVPPGNPDNAHTVSVSVNALEAHLAHGDSEGECENEGQEGDDDEDDEEDDEGDDDEEDDDEGDDDEQVVICHIPPGNPANARTITVDADALGAHLGHGDYEGECEGDDQEGDEEAEEGEEEGGLEGNYPDPDHPGKVLICHVPPGNAAQARTQSVSPNAVAGHASHSGDYDGPCDSGGSG